VLSPFGLGVLDLAVGSFVLEAAIASNATIAIPDFLQQPGALAEPAVDRAFPHRTSPLCEGGHNAAIA